MCARLLAHLAPRAAPSVPVARAGTAAVAVLSLRRVGRVAARGRVVIAVGTAAARAPALPASSATTFLQV